jgi:LysM repeat protein
MGKISIRDYFHSSGHLKHPRWYNLSMRAMPIRSGIYLMIITLLTACSAGNRETTGTGAPRITLLPYSTETLVTTLSTVGAPTTSPAATLEPVTYSVVAGDSLSTIAFRFGVDLAALMQANPGINADAMSIGTKLIIPSTGSQDLDQTAVFSGLPTPVIQSIKQSGCYRMDLEQWICFLLIHNDHMEAVENVSGQIQLPGSSVDIPAANPLDIIPPGESIPLVATIQIPELDSVDGRLVSAILVSPTDPRYGDITINNQRVSFNTDKRIAEINGTLLLPDGGIPRLVAYAVNTQGQVLCYRVWEGAGLVSAGETQTFNLHLYSLNGAIHEVHLVAQAKL